MKDKEKCKYFKEIDYGYRQSKQCYAQKCAPEVYCNGNVDDCSKYPKITEKIKQDFKIKDKEKIELKPCPFCGHRAYVGRTADGLWYYVYCGNEDCDVSPKTKEVSRKESAISYWNRRVENER